MRGASTGVEGNSLSQRKIAGIVDGVCGPAHIVFPRVRAGFPSAAGILFATERTTDLGAAGADIDVGDAAIGSRGTQELFRLAQIVGENAGGEALVLREKKVGAQ